MPRVRDVLHRFRPSGAPGAATTAGVPVDRATELATELEPVLALLADTDRECADVVEAARRDGTAIRARDADRARSVVAAGRALVEAERAAAVARTRGLVGEGGEAGHPAARPEAPAPVRRGRSPVDEAIDEHVEVVVDAVRSLLGVPTRTDDPLAGAR